MSAREEQAALQARKAHAKKVTKELRAHAQELEEKKDDVLDPRKEALIKHFERAQKNELKAKTVEQRLLDAQIFARLGDCAKRQATQLQTGLKDYDRATFVDKLTRLMQQSAVPADIELDDDAVAPHAELNLQELGENVHFLFRAVPSIQFMRGNADVQPRVQKARKPRVVAEKGAVTTKPRALSTGDIPQTETDKQIADMMKELRRRGKMNFWKFVVDPDSYVRSIENVFHSSFLVKDGHARLDLNVDPPTIESNHMSGRGSGSSSQDPDGVAEANEVNSQYIMRFDYNVWKKVCEEYDIRSCILPSQVMLE